MSKATGTRRTTKAHATTPNEKPIPAVVPKFVRYEHLKNISPLTAAQEEVFEKYDKGYNLFLHGMAGTGKTFLAVYLALREVLLGNSEYEKIIIVRSTVPTRDQGFLPGDVQDKEYIYQLPYQSIFSDLIYGKDAMKRLGEMDLYQFISTSYVRGITINNAIVIVDETENLSGHELDSIITRAGENCKIIFCGDKSQSDLQKSSERNGIASFMKILGGMGQFAHIEFGVNDIVRSDLVKAYLIRKKALGIEL